MDSLVSRNVTINRQSNKRTRAEKRKSFNFAIVNARSLPPKVNSLVELFDEYEWTFALITETWMTDGPISEETKRELRGGHGIEIFCTNRPGKNGRNSGGGTAVAIKKSRAAFKPFVVKRNGCEITVVKGLSLIHI